MQWRGKEASQHTLTATSQRELDKRIAEFTADKNVLDINRSSTTGVGADGSYEQLSASIIFEKKSRLLTEG